MGNGPGDREWDTRLPEFYPSLLELLRKRFQIIGTARLGVVGELRVSRVVGWKGIRPRVGQSLNHFWSLGVDLKITQLIEIPMVENFSRLH